MCLWNCNSGMTRQKILHTPNDLRAFAPFKKNKGRHLGRLIPLVTDGAHSPVPGWEITGLLSNTHSCVCRVRCQIPVVCVTPRPRAPMTTEEVIIIWRPWLCWYICQKTWIFLMLLLLQIKMVWPTGTHLQKQLDLLGMPVPSTSAKCKFQGAKHSPEHGAHIPKSFSYLRKCYVLRNGLIC